MTSESAEISHHLLSRKQAARRLTELGLPMSAQTLAHLYSKGSNGPPCIKARGRAYYARDALDAWCAAQFAAPARSSRERREQGVERVAVLSVDPRRGPTGDAELREDKHDRVERRAANDMTPWPDLPFKHG